MSGKTEVVVRVLANSPEPIMATVGMNLMDQTIVVQYDEEDDNGTLIVTYVADPEHQARSIIAIADFLRTTADELTDHDMLVKWAEAQPERGTSE